jgi:hypothetical protein
VYPKRLAFLNPAFSRVAAFRAFTRKMQKNQANPQRLTWLFSMEAAGIAVRYGKP